MDSPMAAEVTDVVKVHGRGETAVRVPDHGVLLADGRVAAHLQRPTADTVLSALTSLGA
ncbi:hypothetical protein [Kutzneria sp. NPDC052558]|uniref:hypothetical protein n=1 Tax=Kutzneria sp. NPDC052558 TaxID=3364121 RepID=UPI0037C712CC